MKKETAIRIVECALESDRTFNDLSMLIEEVDDIEFRRDLKRGVANAISKVYFEILVPIKKRHPDIDIGD
ncbi:MAG: hypothetical protein AAFQ27_04290 [Pseudomonadota bacterium]